MLCWRGPVRLAGCVRRCRFYRKPASHIASVLRGGREEAPRASSSSQKEVFLYGKSENETVESLKRLGLAPVDSKTAAADRQDLVLASLRQFNVSFRQSNKNYNALSRSLRDGAIDEDTRFQIVLAYVIEECRLEVKRLNQFGVRQLQEWNLEWTARKQKQGSDMESKVMSGLFAQQSATTSDSGEEEPYLANTKFLFGILRNILASHLDNWQKVISPVQLAEIFEVFKQIRIDQWKYQGIYLSARILYSTGKIQMDPINESFYINALTKLGYNKEAWKLFKAGELKVNQRWWNELGLMIALLSNDLSRFQKLLKRTDEKFHSHQYLPPKVLRLAVRKFSRIDYKDRLIEDLVSRFISMADTIGITDLKIDERTTYFDDEEQGNKYLNSMEKITYDDMASIIESLLYSRSYRPIASSLMEKFLSLDGVDSRVFQTLLMKTRLSLLKDFQLLEQLLPKSTKSKTTQSKAELQSKFDILRSKYKNVSQDNTIVDRFFFDSVNDLLDNPRLAISTSSLLQDMASTKKGSREKVSKRFNGFLKLLLANGKEISATSILLALETSQKESKMHSSIKFPRLNAHHYATFIQYYTKKALDADRRKNRDKWAFYEKKIVQIMQKVNELNISYNSVYLAKLLVFYREVMNFDRCFQIINTTLVEAEKNIDTDNGEMRPSKVLNQRLYYEMWKVYAKYYRLRFLELTRISALSNYNGRAYHANRTMRKTTSEPMYDLTSLFDYMVNKDNLLPNTRFNWLILDAFIWSREWVALPAVISVLHDKFSVTFGLPFAKYLLVGIKKEFLALETQRQMGDNPSLPYMEARRRALEECFRLKSEGNIFCRFDRSSDDIFSELIKRILLFLKYKNPYDSEFREVHQTYEKLQIPPPFDLKL
ncbi:Sov1p KNAG_0M02530 [Huiozyma naganishii CBS 8797]|uniref:Uncharacterized protein n=1 Tax=Huiozyma naganishii (strain ATCC MYA-139 / BCRC 22969 / CBS 8797 / KCTC 17520 / NBRC 10181 / NCYC 3082 / Yp74L-3) TaxID=1071383 RepID=J7SBK0_HUIN7|nr:hypothetical protein KNAG_0M02530 [Kazachstania naganishii CBS 8797]CCK73106.1 hypothetical protein KNAG_0M02530 [Kazachstania naganishii CBS 8797]